MQSVVKKKLSTQKKSCWVVLYGASSWIWWPLCIPSNWKYSLILSSQFPGSVMNACSIFDNQKDWLLNSTQRQIARTGQTKRTLLNYQVTSQLAQNHTRSFPSAIFYFIVTDKSVYQCFLFAKQIDLCIIYPFFFFPLPYISKKEVEVEDVALRKRNRLGDYKQAFCVWTLQDNGKFQVLSMIEAENWENSTSYVVGYPGWVSKLEEVQFYDINHLMEATPT